MEDTNYKAVAVLVLLALCTFYVLSNDCRICSVMQNPPDWIESWYTGPDKWNAEKGPAG